MVQYDNNGIIQFFKYGWPLNAVDMQEDVSIPRNQKGACNNNKFLKEYIQAELKMGSVIGPFIKNPFGKKARFSPIDTRTKKCSEDLRVILNLSHPRGRGNGSINDSIPKDQFLGEAVKLTYPSVETLAQLVRIKGRGCHIFIRDLTKAYRQMYMDPGDIHLLGYIIDDLYLF